MTNTRAMTAMTIARAMSFGIPFYRRPCIGQTSAMMKTAHTTGAITELATLRAAKIAITAITPTNVRTQRSVGIGCTELRFGHVSWARVGLCNQPGAEPREFFVADRAGLFEPPELLDLIGDTEANNLPELLTCLLSLLPRALCHPCSLGDHVHEHAKVWENE